MANRWTREQKNYFLLFHRQYGRDRTAEEFDIKPYTVDLYVHRFSQHSGSGSRVESSVDCLNGYTQKLLARIEELEAEVARLKAW